MPIPLEKINGVILCGGLGQRLRAAVGDSQKTMAAVNGKPFLDFLLTYLKAQGFRRIILCTGYQADQVERYYGGHTQGLNIVFSRETEPLGTGGAVRNAQGMILGEDFVAINGDSWCDVAYPDLLQTHRDRKAHVTVVVTKRSSQSSEKKDFGVIRMDPAERIVTFREKPSGMIFPSGNESQYVNAGIYCFNRRVFPLMTEKKFSLETDFFPTMASQKNGLCLGFETAGPFFDIGTPERYREAETWVKGREKS